MIAQTMGNATPPTDTVSNSGSPKLPRQEDPNDRTDETQHNRQQQSTPPVARQRLGNDAHHSGNDQQDDELCQAHWVAPPGGRGDQQPKA